MEPTKPLAGGWSRRSWLASALAPALAAQNRGKTFPSEMKRFADPATEFAIERLTDPSHASQLPAWYQRAVARRGSTLLYSSDQPGTLQAFRMDYQSGECRQLTECQALDPASLTFSPDDRAIWYRDGEPLKTASTSGSGEREVYRPDGGWEIAGFNLTSDGLYAGVVERKGERGRVRLVRTGRGTATTLAEPDGVPSDPMPRPKRASLIYRLGGELWLAHFDGQVNRKLPVAAGAVSCAQWAPDGRTILYLNEPEDPKKLVGLRELTPDTGQDKHVANTSQFVHFAMNADGTVFLGASRNVASPHVLLLVRSVRRELTLCEHRARDPRTVVPRFAPSGQRIFYQTDRHGNPAIYSMSIERLVEKTES